MDAPLPVLSHDLHRYKLVRDVIETVLHVPGAFVFGGCVRDSVLHDQAARAFHHHPRTRNLLCSSAECYADASVLPDLRDRLLQPNDVDCWVPASQVTAFIRRLRARRLAVHVPRAGAVPASIYMEGASAKDAESESRRLLRIYVGLSVPHWAQQALPAALRALRVQVDILHGAPEACPRMCSIDFECNALMIDHAGVLRLLPRPQQQQQQQQRRHLTDSMRLAQVVLDVSQRIARVPLEHTAASRCGNLSWARAQHMLRMGWTLLDGRLRIARAVAAPPPPLAPLPCGPVAPDRCLMCLGTVMPPERPAEASHVPEEVAGVVRRDCCAAVYHPACYARLVGHPGFRHACPMCRDPFTEAEGAGCVARSCD